jgi:predicted DNA-binding WGR domain protein
MSTRRFEFRDGKSDKFWDITLDGKETTVHYGRRGTKGQSQTKAWASAADARKFFDTKIAEKTKEGYVEAGLAVETPAPASAPWAPEVSRELERLEITCRRFEPPNAPRPLAVFGEFGRPGGKSWRGDDPDGQVKAVTPAVWAFLRSRPWTPRKFLRTDAGPYDSLGLAQYSAYDVVVDGARRLLAEFACQSAALYFALDLRDPSPDPAVWSVSSETPRTYPPAFRVAYATLSSFLASLAADGARPDQMPPWAPEVTAELVRLRAVVMPYDPKAPRPLSIGGSVVTTGDSWEDVDPEGEVREVAPAVYGFLRNVDFRTRKVHLGAAGDDGETLTFESGNENYDVTVDGKRHLLVEFAINDTQFYRCLDLCDRSPDPAVWSVDHGDSESAYVKFERLSQFLAALRA